MGCGKSTMGRKLAAKLGWSFVDLDHLIEESIDSSIPAYFREFGEEHFRAKEREILQGAAYPENAVIATGGGAPCFFDNMDWMNRNGVTIYLSLTPKALASRLAGESEGRPVLNGLKGPELEAFISSKLDERSSFYNQAQLIVNGIDLTAEKLVALLEPYYLK